MVTRLLFWVNPHFFTNSFICVFNKHNSSTYWVPDTKINMGSVEEMFMPWRYSK